MAIPVAAYPALKGYDKFKLPEGKVWINIGGQSIKYEKNSEKVVFEYMATTAPKVVKEETQDRTKVTDVLQGSIILECKGDLSEFELAFPRILMRFEGSSIGADRRLHIAFAFISTTLEDAKKEVDLAAAVPDGDSPHQQSFLSPMSSRGGKGKEPIESPKLPRDQGNSDDEDLELEWWFAADTEKHTPLEKVMCRHDAPGVIPPGSTKLSIALVNVFVHRSFDGFLSSENELIGWTSLEGIGGVSTPQNICSLLRREPPKKNIKPDLQTVFATDKLGDGRQEIKMSAHLYDYDAKWTDQQKDTLRHALTGASGLVSAIYPPAAPIAGVLAPLINSVAVSLKNLDKHDKIISSRQTLVLDPQPKSDSVYDSFLRNGYYICFRHPVVAGHQTKSLHFEPASSTVMQKGRDDRWHNWKETSYMVYRVQPVYPTNYTPPQGARYAALLEELMELERFPVDAKAMTPEAIAANEKELLNKAKELAAVLMKLSSR